MRKSILGASLALIALLLLSGCQSARQDTPIPDRFVGVNVVTLPSDALDDPARSEPHEPDGQFLMIPFDTSADGEQYSKAIRSGSFESEDFNLRVTDNGTHYSIAATLYMGGQVEEGNTVCIERIYQRSDDMYYAVSTGYYLDQPLMDTTFYDWAETRRVADGDGKMVDETTRVSLTILDAPFPTAAPL